jgi:SAM-dependent methyltransferase
MDRELLRKFLERYPFQPATAVWRAVEVAELTRVAFPAGRGLDLGCGDGKLTRILADRVGGLRLIGLDVDPQETLLALQEGLYEAVHTCSAEHIPEPNQALDFILSVSVMEHIPRLEAVLAEVARLLRAGGILITTVPSAGFHRCLRGPLLPGYPTAAYYEAVDRRLAHLRYWRIDEWRAALERVGMTLEHVRTFLSPAEVRRWETLSRFTAGVLQILFRGQHPIEIQRSLGLRRSTRRMPKPLAHILSYVFSIGLSETAPGDEESAGCLLIVARRQRG